jgi:hypothetical protein
MSWLRKIFGGSEAAPAASASREHKGYTITATPIKEGGQYRLAGTISKEIGGVVKEHRFVRADLFTSRDEAVQFAFLKGQLIIDQSGDGMFSS